MPSGNRAQVTLYLNVDGDDITVSKVLDHVESKAVAIAEMTRMTLKMFKGCVVIVDVEAALWCHDCDYDEKDKPKPKVCNCV